VRDRGEAVLDPALPRRVGAALGVFGHRTARGDLARRKGSVYLKSR
jgi:hypothetical protein